MPTVYDRRRVVVHLTELGRQTAEQMHTALCAHVQRVLEQLGEQDSRELIRLLGRITEDRGKRLNGVRGCFDAGCIRRQFYEEIYSGT